METLKPKSGDRVRLKDAEELKKFNNYISSADAEKYGGKNITVIESSSVDFNGIFDDEKSMWLLPLEAIAEILASEEKQEEQKIELKDLSLADLIAMYENGWVGKLRGRTVFKEIENRLSLINFTNK